MVELQLPDGKWLNVSSYRLDRDPITITRGKSAGDDRAAPSATGCTLRNTDGLFSLRNPKSPLYGLLKRNTPIRISRGTSAFGMVTTGIGRAECADSAALSFTGDLDIRVDLQPHANQSWATASFDLASKYDFVVGWMTCTLMLIAGRIRLSWFPTGTTPPITSETTVSLAAGSDRRTVRATLDVDNGAGGNTVTFYTGPSTAGPWTQVGPAIVTAGVTSLFDAPSKLRIGAASSTSSYSHGHSEATFYAAEYRNGIAGTVVASPNFETRPLDTAPLSPSNFADAQGNNWSYSGDINAARIWWGRSYVRIVGESASWPPRWDQRHRNKYVQVTAADVLRRYQQGKSPVATGLRDFVLSDQTALLSYFPLSSAEGTQYERNIANTNRNVYNFYNEAFPTKPVFKYGVDMQAPWIGTGMEYERDNGGWMRGDTVSWDSNIAFDFVWQSQSLGALSVTLYDYNGALWTLALNDIADSGLGVVSYTDPASGPIAFTSFAVPEINDTDMHIGRLQITNNGANIDFAVYVDGTLRKSGTQPAAQTLGSAYFFIQYSHANTGQLAVNLAHLVTWANATPGLIPTAAAVAAAALGYAGEAAGRRIERVAAAGHLPIAFVGNLDKTTLMGPQFAESRLSQIRDAEATDFGILTSSRTANTMLYRTRASMYNQVPVLTLDYAARVVAPPFEPVDDDDQTRNDVTATRREGGSYRITRTTGPLAATDPPIGIGQYEDDVTVNVQTDAQLSQIAAWQLNQGTLDAARYPSVTVNLGAAEVDDTLEAAIMAADVGDLLRIQNLDDADIPDDLDLLTLGYSETFDNSSWIWTANAAPADMFQVAAFGAQHYDADGSVLTAAITAGATSFQVSKTGTSLWTLTPAAFPLDININGERMTVSGVTGATSPQTFAISARAVNGVSKAHAINSPVKLWSTPRFAL